MASTPPAEPRRVLEQRSIDYVPRAERHGKVWHQAPFWFTGNFVLPTLVIGFIGPELGLSALVSFLAIVLGAGWAPLHGLPTPTRARGWACRR